MVACTGPGSVFQRTSWRNSFSSTSREPPHTNPTDYRSPGLPHREFTVEHTTCSRLRLEFVCSAWGALEFAALRLVRALSRFRCRVRQGMMFVSLFERSDLSRPFGLDSRHNFADSVIGGPQFHANFAPSALNHNMGRTIRPKPQHGSGHPP